MNTNEPTKILTLKPLSPTIVILNTFYYPFKSQLLGTKCVETSMYVFAKVLSQIKEIIMSNFQPLKFWVTTTSS